MAIVDVKYTEEGDAFIEFPPETLEGLGWGEGTVVEWIDNGDGSWTIRKKDMDFVEKVVEFNRIAGTTGDKFDVRKTALYIGLQLEEMAEKLVALGFHPEFEQQPATRDCSDIRDMISSIERWSYAFKTGTYDHLVSGIDRTSALDADIDLAVVALGGACAIGSNVNGACHEVKDSNLSKFPMVNGQRIVLKDDNGKVVKAESYVPPELTQYLTKE